MRLIGSRGGSGTSQMEGQWGGHNSSGGRCSASHHAIMQFYCALYAAELRILLVYLSESLGMLGQSGGGGTGGHIFHGEGAAAPWPPIEPPLIGSYRWVPCCGQLIALVSIAAAANRENCKQNNRK